jgi:vacuolar-type H+-ATPase subunit H
MSGDVSGKTANDNDLATRLLDRLEALEARLVAHDAAETARTAEMATLRETLARTEGELEGMRRASDQSRREVIEAEAKAALSKRAEEEAQATLARIRSRGLVSRILNRDP